MILQKFFKKLNLFVLKKIRGKKSKPGKILDINSGDIPTADIVAISMALHLFYDEVHDDESNVITIKRIERRYSPWSSKIYGINNYSR